MKLACIKWCLTGMAAGITLTIVAAPPLWAGAVDDIDEVIDLTAMAPEDLYQFVPNYYWVQPGDKILFHNSTGKHSVKGVPGFWPDEADWIDIANGPSFEVKLRVPSVYAFRCKVHNRHDMFALIADDPPGQYLGHIEFATMNERA